MLFRLILLKNRKLNLNSLGILYFIIVLFQTVPKNIIVIIPFERMPIPIAMVNDAQHSTIKR